MSTDAPASLPVLDDAAWSAQARAQLQTDELALAARFDAGAAVARLLTERARQVDAQVLAAWQRCVPSDAPLALFAVGGYGRGGLFPQSDIDLLVLGESKAQFRLRAEVERFIALLWDAGLRISQAVRSIDECRQAAAADQTVVTALMEARALAANTADSAALQAAIATPAIWPAAQYFEAKHAEQHARHARFGGTSDNLEPNLKEGPGGLRDLQMHGWLALRSFGTCGWDALVELGHLEADEAMTLQREFSELSRLRYGLHLVAGRDENRLRFDFQKPLAARLGDVDDADALGVEKMMQRFYRSAALVQRLNDRLLQRFEEHFHGRVAIEPLDESFEIRGGYLSTRTPGWLLQSPANVVAVFAAWAAHPTLRGLHSRTASELAQALPSVPNYRAADAALRASFMALLRGAQPVASLERMARLGVLGRWIPEFARISGRMQFDLFHAYTVDQHTLTVLRNLALFASGQDDERFAVAHTVWPSLRKPELLLLAGLFHDIGKGRGGDHSELGAVDAREFCLAHELTEVDTALVEWLVRRHLLMSVVAQKQDITDPQVIHVFASEVGDRQRLDYLYLLTCADIAGTSPKLWNSWKDRLLADLHAATRLALRRGLGQTVAAEERIDENRAAAQALLVEQGHSGAEIAEMFRHMPRENFLRSRPEQIAWQASAMQAIPRGGIAVAVRAPLGRDPSGRDPSGRDGLEVLVHMPERDGLFAAIVMTLDRLGLNVLQARVLDGPGGTIFDSFHVTPEASRGALPLEAVQARLRHALIGEISGLRPARRTQPRHLRHFRVVPRIEFTDIAGATRIELVCTDRPGLLAAVAWVLREQRLRVHDARIATFGERVEDLLLVSDEHDRPLPPAQCDALRVALLAILDGET